MNIRIAALTLGVCAMASSAMAQINTGGTITDANAQFTQGDYLGDATGTGGTSAFHVGGIDNPDHVFQTWWWYRGELNGVTRELALADGTNAQWSGNTGRVDYTLPGIGTARAVYSVQGLEDGYGSLAMSLIVRNTTSEPLTLNFFNFMDTDMNASSGGDVADQIGDNVIRITDGDWVATYEGTDIFQVGQFSSIRDMLTDGDADDFTGGGLPFPTGDVTSGFQWQVTILPNRAVTLTSSLTITQIPAPGAAVLFGAGLGVIGFRRKR